MEKRRLVDFVVSDSPHGVRTTALKSRQGFYLSILPIACIPPSFVPCPVEGICFKLCKLFYFITLKIKAIFKPHNGLQITLL